MVNFFFSMKGLVFFYVLVEEVFATFTMKFLFVKAFITFVVKDVFFKVFKCFRK